MRARIKEEVLNSFGQVMLVKGDVVTILQDCQSFVVCHPDYYFTSVYVMKSNIEILDEKEIIE